MDEERKSVRFDIEKEVDIKYTYSRSEYESESESDEQEVLAMLSNRDTEWSPSAQKIGQRFTGEESKDDPEDKIDGCIKKSLSSERIEASKTQNGKIVGKRFVVRNVPENELRKKFAPQNASEKEHRMQMTRDSLSGESLSRESSLDYTFTNKFNKIKNIDLVSKSETDYSDSELRRKNKLRVEFPRNEQTDDDETSDFSKINQETRDISRKEANEATKQQDQSKKLEETKAKLSQEHEKDIEALRKEYKDKLEQMKKELEENFAEQKKQLEKNLSDKLEDMRRKMVEKVFFYFIFDDFNLITYIYVYFFIRFYQFLSFVKEEREIQKLIAEMDEAKLENLRKVKAELEVCYEKERQEILANLKTELDERKGELLELRNQEMGKLENEHERDLDEEKLAKLSEIKLSKQHQARIKTMKKELDKEFDELRKQLRAQQRENITKITEEHESRLVEILRDFRVNVST